MERILSRVRLLAAGGVILCLIVGGCLFFIFRQMGKASTSADHLVETSKALHQVGINIDTNLLSPDVVYDPNVGREVRSGGGGVIDAAANAASKFISALAAGPEVVAPEQAASTAMPSSSSVAPPPPVPSQEEERQKAFVRAKRVEWKAALETALVEEAKWIASMEEARKGLDVGVVKWILLVIILGGLVFFAFFLVGVMTEDARVVDGFAEERETLIAERDRLAAENAALMARVARNP